MSHPSDAELIEFDDANETHLARHGVAPSEIIEVFDSDPLWAPNAKGHSAEWLMIGRTLGNRPLVVAVTFDDVRSALRPITARTCEKYELLRWNI